MKGIANHTGPKPCVDVRKDGGEASAGVRAGRVLSREILHPECGNAEGILWGADAFEEAESRIGSDEDASRSRTPRGRRPRARTELTRTGTGRSQRCPWPKGATDRTVKPNGERR